MNEIKGKFKIHTDGPVFGYTNGYQVIVGWQMGLEQGDIKIEITKLYREECIAHLVRAMSILDKHGFFIGSE